MKSGLCKLLRMTSSKRSKAATKLFNEAVRGKIPSTDRSAYIDSDTYIDVNNGVEQRRVAEVHKGLESSSISLSFSKEIIIGYDRSSCANIWTSKYETFLNCSTWMQCP